MFRISTICCILVANVAFVGCSHFMETRTLKQFTAALEEQNLEEMKAISSDNFSDKALRLDESAKDFKLLKLPTEDLKIVEVLDKSDTYKQVNVQVGKTSKTVLYHMVKEEGSRKWVIDDITMNRRGADNLKIYEKVTIQMDLFLSVREFLQTWNQGNRDRIQDRMTSEFAGVLKQLPDTYFQHLHKKADIKKDSLKRFKPKATIDDDTAVVRLNRKKGQLDIGLKQIDGVWLVNDMAVESSKDELHITSMKKSADALRSVAIFLKGYGANDKPTIETVTTGTFYKNSIQPGQLTEVTLPDHKAFSANSRFKIQANRIDVDISHGREIASISLKTTEREEGNWEKPGYLVSGVTLHSKEASGSSRKLSSVLTAKARVNIFHQAFVTKDLRALKYSSSSDFNNKIWNNIDNDLIKQLPFDLPATGEFVVDDIHFNGTLTEVYATYANTPVTYVLRERSGAISIDDVKYPKPGRPNSFKDFMEVVLPVYLFAQTSTAAQPPEELQDIKDYQQLQKLGTHYQQAITRMRSICSFDFNHAVWRETDVIPDTIFASAEHFSTPVTSVNKLDNKTYTIQFGDQFWGADVKVVSEKGAFRVDEIKLIAGEGANYDLKIAAKDQLNTKGRYLRSFYPVSDFPNPENMENLETQIAKEAPQQPIQFKPESEEASPILNVVNWQDEPDVSELEDVPSFEDEIDFDAEFQEEETAELPEEFAPLDN